MRYLILLTILSLYKSVLSANDPQHCFDVLEITPESEIKKFSEMSFKETASATLNADIFSCFLEESRYGDGEKSDTEKYYDIYKKCNEYMKYATNEPIGDQQLIELNKLGLPDVYGDFLSVKIKTKEMKLIKESILFIKEEMAKSIEGSTEFKTYKKFISQQLGGPKIKHIGKDETNLKSENSGQKSYIKDISNIMLFKYLFLLLTILMFL